MLNPLIPCRTFPNSCCKTASISGLFGDYGIAAYNAMKAALLNYSGALSQDLAPKGIRVNAVSPGPIMVEGGAWDRIKTHMKQFYDATLAQIPLGRMGQPDEVAATVAMLVSPRSGFTTGTNVVVDGGITKRIQY